MMYRVLESILKKSAKLRTFGSERDILVVSLYNYADAIDTRHQSCFLTECCHGVYHPQRSLLTTYSSTFVWSECPATAMDNSTRIGLPIDSIYEVGLHYAVTLSPGEVDTFSTHMFC